MLKRMEKIYHYIVKKTREDQMATVTTSEIAEVFNIQRTNASKDLNQLTREDLLKKSSGRPVEYSLNNVSSKDKHVQSYKEEQQPRVKQTPQRIRVSAVTEKDIFAKIIGMNGSMKNAGEQAKAAILYPPKGLNCLITGPTGSGKTYFAHAMFQFAKASEVIAQDKELIVFNCADYANNPELLMSHLFGHSKGAFTGAQQEKEGVIDQADGGVLLLDEIHRLPPEGQEMIFYFMDHGKYSRLGETGKKHQAEVRIIGATTEDPNSTLLDTFVRRIPINIQLPSFAVRPAAEKIDLVKMMVSREAKRIERTISLTEDVVKALIGSVSYGNIGQLKSNVQLVCARGFLNHMQEEQVDITMEDVPEGIRSGLLLIADHRQMSSDLSQNLQSKLIIPPNEELFNIQADAYELPYNLYDIIGDKAQLLKADGIDQETINHFISTDINVHLKSFYKDHGFSFYSDNKLSEFVDPKIIELTNQIYSMATNRLGSHFQSNFIYAMSLHISSFLKKMQLGEKRKANDNIKEMVNAYPQELELAREVRHLIGEWFNLFIPENEIYYLAVLLISLRTTQQNEGIGVVVAAHGNSTASSMVEVVRQLLDAQNVTSVDMPLDMPPKVALEKLKQATLSVDQGGGILLLVDMGSLATFNEVIQRETGVSVRTIDMVTTPLVLEAVRKASVFGTDLEELYESLRNFHGYSALNENVLVQATHLPKAILAICASGEGTAKHIKNMIQNVFDKKAITDVEVLTISAVDMAEQLTAIQQSYHLIAATGVVDPQLAVPFISLENFLTHDTSQLLEKLLMNTELELVDMPATDQENTQEICLNYLEQNFTFLNPKKIIEPLWQFTREIMYHWEVSETEQGFLINFLLHSAGMIERIILQQPLTGTKEEIKDLQADPAYAALHVQVLSLDRTLNITVPLAEEYYLLALIKRQINIF
ncbi:MAG TPA: sigma 54-interacting transcriptional regulator [Tetragenococcus sp.]|nr:sigma 54-interacting transcriptional regulator [Tetragenococcus sp.]